MHPSTNDASLVSRREFLDRSAVLAAGGLAVLHGAANPTAVMAADELLPRFDPPGNLDDLNDSQKKVWSDFISGRMDAEITGDLEGRRLQFYNPTKTATTADKATAVISW